MYGNQNKTYAAVDKSTDIKGNVIDVVNRNTNSLQHTEGSIDCKVNVANTHATETQEIYLLDNAGWCNEFAPVTNQLPTAQVTGTLGAKTYDMLKQFSAAVDVRGLHFANITGNFLASGTVTICLARWDGTVEKRIIALTSLTDSSDNNITYRKIATFAESFNQLKSIKLTLPPLTSVAMTMGVTALGLSAQMESVNR